MYYWQEKDIKITKKSKILIGLGDSFTQGEGACTVDIWEKYQWDTQKMYKHENIDVLKSSYDNSWVNQICKNYLKDFIPINLGVKGNGNRSACKELYLHPELKMEDAKEKIVVFMLTGMERFDFIHGDFSEHTHFRTIWPFASNVIDLHDISNSYGRCIYNNRFGTIELILNILDVVTWCKANDAKLILTSAFTPDYNKKDLIRKIKGQFNKENKLFSETKRIELLVNKIPWNEFLYPDKYNSFSDFLLKLEGREDLIDPYTPTKFYEFAKKFDKFSNKGYITKCGHPSEKGHLVITEKIYEHIKKLNYI
jgi:hypothetical protein